MGGAWLDCSPARDRRTVGRVLEIYGIVGLMNEVQTVTNQRGGPGGARAADRRTARARTTHTPLHASSKGNH